MVMDPLIIGLTVPHRRQCHFWAAKEFFKGPLGALLTTAGAVPVDRKNRDNNALLYKETLETLARGGVMALFPEGTSYTSPHILQLKDGASRVALEFARQVLLTQLPHLQPPPDAPAPPPPAPAPSAEPAPSGADAGADTAPPPKREAPPGPVPTAEELASLDYFKTACIVPVGINYIAKQSWRSDVMIEYGPAIEIEEYLPDYFTEPRAAVKRLTERLFAALRQLTVNATDWYQQAAALAEDRPTRAWY